MPAVTPRPRSIAEVKHKLLNPALTSHFQVVIGKPPLEDGSFNRFLSESGAYHDADRLNIMLYISARYLPRITTSSFTVTSFTWA